MPDTQKEESVDTLASIITVRTCSSVMANDFFAYTAKLSPQAQLRLAFGLTK